MKRISMAIMAMGLLDEVISQFKIQRSSEGSILCTCISNKRLDSVSGRCMNMDDEVAKSLMQRLVVVEYKSDIVVVIQNEEGKYFDMTTTSAPAKNGYHCDCCESCEFGMCRRK